MLLRRGHVGQERTAHTHHNTLYYKTVHIRNTVTAGEKDADTKSHPEVHNGKFPMFRRENRIGMDRTGVNRVRPGRAGLNRARLDWADRTGLGWAGLDSSRNQAMTAPQQRHTTTHPSTKRNCNSSGSPSQIRPTMRPAAMSTERIRRSRSRSSSRRPAYL